MTEGASLTAAVWDGAVPICLSLEPHEVATARAPPSLFLLAPRQAFLPLLSAACATHFADALPPGVDAVWFSANGVPLKWQIPTGVLYDLLGGGELPWRLNVHFRGYPDSTLLPCTGPEAVRGQLLNALKESCFLSCGSASAIMTLPASATADVWQGLLDHDFSRYTRGVTVLRAAVRATRGVSIRLHVVPNAATDVTSSSHAYQLTPERASLRCFLREVLPADWADGAAVQVQGIEPPLDARLDCLSAQFSGPDGFLHVCVRLCGQSSASAAG